MVLKNLHLWCWHAQHQVIIWTAIRQHPQAVASKNITLTVSPSHYCPYTPIVYIPLELILLILNVTGPTLKLKTFPIGLYNAWCIALDFAMHMAWVCAQHIFVYIFCTGSIRIISVCLFRFIVFDSNLLLPNYTMWKFSRISSKMSSLVKWVIGGRR